jgi:hypothetical protein
MALGLFEVVFTRSKRQHYHALIRKLAVMGYTEEQVLQELNELAIRHSDGRRPDGFTPLTQTPDLKYPSYGGKIFGVPITYHVRQTARLIVIESITV